METIFKAASILMLALIASVLIFASLTISSTEEGSHRVLLAALTIIILGFLFIAAWILLARMKRREIYVPIRESPWRV